MSQHGLSLWSNYNNSVKNIKPNITTRFKGLKKDHNNGQMHKNHTNLKKINPKLSPKQNTQWLINVSKFKVNKAIVL